MYTGHVFDGRKRTFLFWVHISEFGGCATLARGLKFSPYPSPTKQNEDSKKVLKWNETAITRMTKVRMVRLQKSSDHCGDMYEGFMLIPFSRHTIATHHKSPVTMTETNNQGES